MPDIRVSAALAARAATLPGPWCADFLDTSSPSYASGKDLGACCIDPSFFYLLLTVDSSDWFQTLQLFTVSD